MKIKILELFLFSVNILCISHTSASLSSFVDGFANLFGSKSDPKTKSKASVRSKRQSGSIEDESPYMYEITSTSLPTTGSGKVLNTRYMPTIGNGYIGATIYEDYMYLNGLYNGAGGNSHRAAIPALMMTKIIVADPDIDRRAIRKYTLNARDGYFLEYINCDFAEVWHKTYMHEKYIRLMVSDIYIKKKDSWRGGGTLLMNYPSLNSSDDIRFDSIGSYYGNRFVRGQTKEAEAGASTTSFFIYYMDPLRQISVNETEANYTYFMSIDKVQANAQSDFDSAQRIVQNPQGNYNLFMEHVDAWRKIWNRGRIELEGERQLVKTTWLSQYYLLSSLPSPFPDIKPIITDPYYGCSRTGLGKGRAGKDYQGHVMWDSEFYIMGAILPLQPDMAKELLRYRSYTLRAAQANAAKYGAVGAHYPWESAFTGADVTAQTCPANDPQCNWRRMFVSASVAWGIRQYYSLTRDRDYIVSPIYSGCDVAVEIAKFYASRAVYAPESGRYNIRNITGPDDWHPNKNNNAFTLCAASLAIHWARYFSCMAERNEREDVPDEFIEKAMHLNLPFDNARRIHYEYEGFNPATDVPIKQADAIMLNYPLNWNYSLDIVKNDLEYYENYISETTPAMTWSWYTIGWKWVSETSKMAAYFLKSYNDYTIQPFKIWTEYPERTQSDQDSGNVNFLPGMGAFLQSLMNGFGGVRIRPDKVEFFNPIPPTGATKMLLHGFKYMGTNMTFTIEANKVTIQVWNAPSNKVLLLKRNETVSVEETLYQGVTVVIEPANNGFSIYPQIEETCEHPRDYIYMPCGPATSSNNFSNGGQQCHTHFTVFVTTSLLMMSILYAVCRVLTSD